MATDEEHAEDRAAIEWARELMRQRDLLGPLATRADRERVHMCLADEVPGLVRLAEEALRLRAVAEAARAYRAAEAATQSAALTADSPTDPALLDAITASHRTQQALFAALATARPDDDAAEGGAAGCEECGETQRVRSFGTDHTPLCPRHYAEAQRNVAAAERDGTHNYRAY